MPATHHKISMNSDQTTTQCKFMAIFMVLIYAVLGAKEVGRSRGGAPC